MISKEDIKKLADLARIEVSEQEAEKLGGEIDSILEYVSQVSNFAKASLDEVETTQLQNVWREDNSPNESGLYSKDLIAEFPSREGDLLKVKKIL